MNEIFTRRSVRRFTPEPVSPQDAERVLRAAMQAPSAGNQQPWEFIALTDRAMIDKLARVSQHAAPLLSATLAVVVLANGNGIRFPGCVPADLGAATQNLLLEAHSIGLGGVWLAIADFPERVEYARKLFALPEGVAAFAAVALGHPAENPKPADRFVPAKVHYGGY
ncbi:MAG: nitroreductase family protein [Clostridiales bacterium]|jgi:nitroreductase|nr:nitroreductase family protein [Clostridiales bacterium]